MTFSLWQVIKWPGRGQPWNWRMAERMEEERGEDGSERDGGREENVTRVDSGLVSAPIPPSTGAREDVAAWILNKEVGE